MIVILTGAGVSQESGLSTFRGSGGLWENERIEDVVSPRGFARDPDRVHAFYNARRRALLADGIKPNAAHEALARLETQSREPVLLITQNVDNLHERAGSRQPLHMHGELLKARCTHCETVLPWEWDLSRDDSCPGCDAQGTLRPHIVWFEEMPLYMDIIERALEGCRVFASIGTSGKVYPAAGFALVARGYGAHVVELNLEPSAGAELFHEGRYGKASKVVPAWVDECLEAEKR